MNIKPLKSDEDYEEALQRVYNLMSAELNTPEGDELEVLSTLIEAYERKYFRIDAPTPIEAIKFVMEQQGLTRKDIEPYLGNRARVSQILNHKRTLTLPMIRNLHKNLGIPAEILIAKEI